MNYYIYNYMSVGYVMIRNAEMSNDGKCFDDQAL